jgi:tetratricopeptide (TPR) repeat protein
MSKDTFEKIDKYLRGKMSHKEQLAFEAEVASNKELANYLNIYRSIEKEMQEHVDADENEVLLKRSLEKLTPKYFNMGEAETGIRPTTISSQYTIPPINGRTDKTIKLWKALAVAVVVIGVIVLSIPFLFKNTSTNALVVSNKKTDTVKNILKQESAHLQQKRLPENVAEKGAVKTKTETQKKSRLNNTRADALYAAYFKPDALPNDIPVALQHPLGYYETGDYSKAIEAFKTSDAELISRGEEADKKLNKFYISYYTALSYMSNGNAAKAIPELKNGVAGSPDTSYHLKAMWYLSLAYLKTGNETKAKELLKQIAVNKTELEFKQMSVRLLKELK